MRGTNGSGKKVNKKPGGRGVGKGRGALPKMVKKARGTGGEKSGGLKT